MAIGESATPTTRDIAASLSFIATPFRISPAGEKHSIGAGFDLLPAGSPSSRTGSLPIFVARRHSAKLKHLLPRAYRRKAESDVGRRGNRSIVARTSIDLGGSVSSCFTRPFS